MNILKSDRLNRRSMPLSCRFTTKIYSLINRIILLSKAAVYKVFQKSIYPLGKPWGYTSDRKHKRFHTEDRLTIKIIIFKRLLTECPERS